MSLSYPFQRILTEGVFKLDKNRRESLIFHSCSSNLDSLKDNKDENEQEKDEVDDEDEFFSDEHSSSEEEGVFQRQTMGSSSSSKQRKVQVDNHDSVEEVGRRGGRGGVDRPSTNYWTLPSLHFSWRISSVTKHSKRKSSSSKSITATTTSSTATTTTRKRGEDDSSSSSEDENNNDSGRKINNQGKNYDLSDGIGKNINKDFDLAGKTTEIVTFLTE